MTNFIDAPETPIERAARRLNTLHHHLDMPRRRREARVAAEGLLDVEVMAEVLDLHAGEAFLITGGGQFTECPTCGEVPTDLASHQAAALRAALLGGQA